jgi:hypothetical protein
MTGNGVLDRKVALPSLARSADPSLLSESKCQVVGTQGPRNVLVSHEFVRQLLRGLAVGPLHAGPRAILSLSCGGDFLAEPRVDIALIRFIFQRDDAPEVLAPYAVSDTNPPSSPVKLLDAMLFVPYCSAMSRPMAFIDASFDDVMVNESAAPRAER